MDRRAFLVSTAAAGTFSLAGPLLPSARAVTEEDLAVANFGAASELLVKDFYGNALQTKLVRGPGYRVLRQGRSAAARHARTLSRLLEGAGDAPPVEEDFEFAWPEQTFRTADSILETGIALHRALQGAYQAGAASATVPSYRVLYTSLASSAGQQLGALTVLSGEVELHPFPVALELEAASAALERYLG
jgi:ferritin-like protein